MYGTKKVIYHQPEEPPYLIFNKKEKGEPQADGSIKVSDKLDRFRLMEVLNRPNIFVSKENKQWWIQQAQKNGEW